MVMKETLLDRQTNKQTIVFLEDSMRNSNREMDENKARLVVVFFNGVIMASGNHYVLTSR